MKTIEEVQQEIEDVVMNMENVSGVYIGKRNGKPVIKIGLTKMDSKTLGMIPKEKAGYEIVVEEVGKYSSY